MGRVTTFDRLFAEATPLVLQGLHRRDSPPVDAGDRWPVTVMLRPDAATAARLELAMAEVEKPAGGGHFRTGSAGSVHFTVRVLELYRKTIGVGDAAIRRYAGAMSRAAGQVGTIGLDLVGLTLTPGSVMVCGRPLDDNADRLMDLLTDELGEDAWLEAGFRRDIWYANILHFAADIPEPGQLVDWVADRRDLDLGHALINSAELVRFHYEDGAEGRLMRPEVLAAAGLGIHDDRPLERSATQVP